MKITFLNNMRRNSIKNWNRTSIIVFNPEKNNEFIFNEYMHIYDYFEAILFNG